MREFLPGLLPEQKRAKFRDPDWDKRDDSVPIWVTIVHVGFLAWTRVGKAVLDQYRQEKFGTLVVGRREG